MLFSSSVPRFQCAYRTVTFSSVGASVGFSVGASVGTSVGASVGASVVAGAVVGVPAQPTKLTTNKVVSRLNRNVLMLAI